MTLDSVDAHLADDKPFLAWIDRLEGVMKEWNAKHNNLPYSLPLAECTGLLVWHDSFTDGMTPAEAFESDMTYWED